jgi:hypothetical protein
MNHQQSNLLRLINKYSVRYGEQDPLVLELKKEVIELQLRQINLSFLEKGFLKEMSKSLNLCKQFDSQVVH